MSESQLQWTMAQINQQQTLRSMEGGAGVQLATPADMAAERQPATQPGMMQPNPMQGQVTQQAPTVIVQNQQPSGAGTSAMIGGLAAATGAMAGTAIASSMYGYSTPDCPGTTAEKCYYSS